jgi:hypothetical protein
MKTIQKVEGKDIIVEALKEYLRKKKRGVDKK